MLILILCSLLFFVILWSLLGVYYLLAIGGNRENDFHHAFIGFFSIAITVICLSGITGNVGGIIFYINLTIISLVYAFLAITHIYFRDLGTKLNFDDIYAFFQSDIIEIGEYCTGSMLSTKSIASAIVVFAGTQVFFLFVTKFVAHYDLFYNNIIPCFLSVAFLSIAILELKRTLVVELFINTYHHYHKDIQSFNEIATKLVSKGSVHFPKREKGEVFILIIGESLSRDFMHVYNGPADNTPWLDKQYKKEGWYFFNNAYSFHTHTARSLVAVLTDGRALTGITFPDGENIISLSNQAGMKTVWLSNQPVMGKWDNPVSAIAHQAKRIRFAGKYTSVRRTAPKPDEVLLPMLEEELNNLSDDENVLIVIHLMGNHWPYTSRVPESFHQKRYSSKAQIGSLADKEHYDRQKLHEEYLNSIEYSDQMIQAFFEIINRRVQNRPSVLIYFSDHGEDIFSKDGRHNFAKFTWTKARIPLFLWASPSFKDRYPDKCKCLADHLDSIVTNDLLFDLYVGLSNIKTSYYKAEYDLADSRYKLTSENAMISHKKMVKTDDKLHLYKNTKSHLNHKAYVHMANTLFKCKQAFSYGIKRLEIDILLEERSSVYNLMIGHNKNTMTGLSLETFSSYFIDKLDFIWLDCKGMNKNNFHIFFDLLEKQNEKFFFKNKIVIESSFAKGLSNFTKHGWETSLFLNWKHIKEKLPSQPINEYFEYVSSQIIDYNIKGITYTKTIHNAVHSSLKGQLPKNFIYNILDYDIAYSDIDFFDKMNSYSDANRVQITLNSPYNMNVKGKNSELQYNL